MLKLKNMARGGAEEKKASSDSDFSFQFSVFSFSLMELVLDSR
jgi:hypothetical protein